VFGNIEAADTEQVLKNWDAIKRETKGEGTTHADLLRNVPRALPALMRAAKVQGRAKRAGLDLLPDVSEAMEALDGEIFELKETVEIGIQDLIEEAFGDLLFAAVNVSRFLKIDAEQALTAATDKFIRRFDGMEKLAAERGIVMENAPPSKLDELWEYIKCEDCKNN